MQFNIDFICLDIARWLLLLWRLLRAYTTLEKNIDHTTNTCYTILYSGKLASWGEWWMDIAFLMFYSMPKFTLDTSRYHIYLYAYKLSTNQSWLGSFFLLTILKDLEPGVYSRKWAEWRSIIRKIQNLQMKEHTKSKMRVRRVVKFPSFNAERP